MHGDEAAAAFGRRRAPRPAATDPRCAAWQAGNRGCRPASRPNWRYRRPAGRRAHRRTRPESSDSAGKPVASAAALALISAFSSKVVPVSSGSARPNSLAERSVSPNGDDQVGEFPELAGIVAGHDDRPGAQQRGHQPRPDRRFGEFDRIARRVAEIDRAAAVRPSKSASMATPCASSAASPGVDLRAAGGKAQMPGAVRAMRRHRQRRTGRRRHRGGVGVEQQQHALAAAEEDMAPGDR